MKIIKKTAYKPEEHACVVIPVFQGMKREKLWREFPGLEFPARQKKMKGEIGEALACHSLEQQRLFLLVGAGRPGRLPDARKLACKAMALLRENRVAKAWLYFTDPGPYPAEYLRNLVDYLHLNNYRFDRYKKKKGRPVARLQLAFKVPAEGPEDPRRGGTAPQKEIIGKDVFPLLGEMSQDAVRASLGLKDLTPRFAGDGVPARPPSLCAGCPHTAFFFNLGVLKVQSKGDIGCYTLGALRPLSAMDTCVDMGASITVQLGIEKALEKSGKATKQVAVIGDSTFFHSGITGLVDVIYNQGKSTVVILDNSITAMTGHQENPGSGKTLMGQDARPIDIVKLVRDGLGLEHTYEVDGYEVKAIRDLLKREMERQEPSVIVVRRPCVLLYRKAKWSPMVVDKVQCTSCKVCLRLGCPAISSDAEGHALINEALCTGCGVCAQGCAFKAIRFVDDRGMHINSMTLGSYANGGGK